MVDATPTRLVVANLTGVDEMPLDIPMLEYFLRRRSESAAPRTSVIYGRRHPGVVAPMRLASGVGQTSSEAPDVDFDTSGLGLVGMWPENTDKPRGPSMDDVLEIFRTETGRRPYVHEGLPLDTIPAERLQAGAGNLEGPLAMLPTPTLALPRNYSPSELPEYAGGEPLTLSEPSPFEAALGRRLPPPTPIVRGPSTSGLDAPFVNLSGPGGGVDVTDRFGIEELESSPEFEEVGTFDFGRGPSRMFHRVLQKQDIDDMIEEAYRRADRTGSPDDYNALGALLRIKDQEADASAAGGGLTFEERLQLKQAEPPGLTQGRKDSAAIQERKMDLSAEQNRFLNELRERKMDQERIEAKMRLIKEQAADARWKIENSDDEQEVMRAAQTLRALVGFRREIMSILEGEASEGGKASTAKTAPKRENKGKPRQEDYVRARKQVLAENPSLTEDDILDAMLDMLEGEGFSVFREDE